MRPRCCWLLAIAALLGMPAQAQPGGKPTQAYSAQVATDWFALALQLVQQTPGLSPPVAARALAYLGLTLYESVVPGMPAQQSLAGQLSELESLPWAQPDEPLHWPSVANAALATMMRMMLPSASAENRARIDSLERSLPLTDSRDFDMATLDAELSNRSAGFGRLMAMALMTWARTDGGHEAWAPLRRNQPVYVPPSGPGQWATTPPGFSPPLLPQWGQNRPFIRSTGKPGGDCPAPPALLYSEAAGSAMHAEALEVYGIANAASASQRQFALYWADDAGKTPTPAGHWAHIAADLLKARQANLAEAALAYARLNIAMSDGLVAAWRSKYDINLLRPVTYIQLEIDSNWLPALMHTPNFPEYPSGHSVVSSAAADVLSAQFGAATAFVDTAHNDRGWGPRSFASLRAAADEASVSRLYAGIHFRSGVTGGQVQGRCVAQQVLALKFSP